MRVWTPHRVAHTRHHDRIDGYSGGCEHIPSGDGLLVMRMWRILIVALTGVHGASSFRFQREVTKQWGASEVKLFAMSRAAVLYIHQTVV